MLADLWLEADARVFDSLAPAMATSPPESSADWTFGVPSLVPNAINVLVCDENSEGAGGPWNPDSSQNFQKSGARLLVFGAANLDQRVLIDLQSRPGTVVAGFGRVELKDVLTALARDFGVRNVVVAWGGSVCEALLREGLVNELKLVLSPEVLGRPSRDWKAASPQSPENLPNREAGGGFAASRPPGSGHYALRGALGASVAASLVGLEQLDNECFTFWKLSYRTDFSEKVDSAGSEA